MFKIKINRFLVKYGIKTLIVILITIFVVCILRFLNEYYKNLQRPEKSQLSYTEERYREKSYSVLDGSYSSVEKIKSAENLVEKFISCCNKKEYENAYSLLSTNCKKYAYNDFYSFKTSYCDAIFNSEKTFTIQLWYESNIGSTYKVRILNDIISTGIYDSSNIKEGYYTIVYENNEEKLSIGNFIDYIDINKITEDKGISVNIIGREIYMDYSIYNLIIKNNTDKIILLNTDKIRQTVFIIGKNDVQYSAFMYELLDNDKIFLPNEEKSINIKFNKKHTIDTKIVSMTFSDIVMDYEKYLENEEEYVEREKIDVDVF